MGLFPHARPMSPNPVIGRLASDGGRKHNAVLDIDAIIRDERNNRFSKIPSEKIVNGIDES